MTTFTVSAKKLRDLLETQSSDELVSFTVHGDMAVVSFGGATIECEGKPAGMASQESVEYPSQRQEHTAHYTPKLP